MDAAIFLFVSWVFISLVGHHMSKTRGPRQTKFNKKLIELMRSKGMTDSDLCTFLDIEVGSIGRWRVGRGKPTKEQMEKIAQLFDTDISEFR